MPVSSENFAIRAPFHSRSGAFSSTAYRIEAPFRSVRRFRGNSFISNLEAQRTRLRAAGRASAQPFGGVVRDRQRNSPVLWVARLTPRPFCASSPEDELPAFFAASAAPPYP